MSDKILKLDQAQTLYQDLRGRIDALPTSEDIPEVPVQDVQVAGTSVVNNGIANIPVADSSNLGLVKIGSNRGIDFVSNDDKTLRLVAAQPQAIHVATSDRMAITPYYQHYSAFYGLAKAAGASDINANVNYNTIGTYTDEAKTAIQNMLGITDALAAKLDATDAGLKVVRLI